MMDKAVDPGFKSFNGIENAQEVYLKDLIVCLRRTRLGTI
jgi:hypothetical protein